MWHCPQGTYRLVGDRNCTHGKTQRVLEKRGEFVWGLLSGKLPVVWALCTCFRVEVETQSWGKWGNTGSGPTVFLTLSIISCFSEPHHDLRLLHYVQWLARSPWTSPSFTDVTTLSIKALPPCHFSSQLLLGHIYLLFVSSGGIWNPRGYNFICFAHGCPHRT